MIREWIRSHGELHQAPWQKRLAFYWKRLSWLYAQPEPLPYTRQSWLALGVVAGAVILFCGFFIYYLTMRHLAYGTNAEDLGIMDQALWNTLHGQPLHQTICNTISDTNCAGIGGVTRFAIHFEPILFPTALLYLIWPDPCVLLVTQTIIVGLGAFPAFWLARLRLRNELAGTLIALVYLLYPVQQQATVFDFHAVTFTTSLLLFAFYFLYTRRTLPLLICTVLAMGCKEEIPLLVILLGAWTLVFQRRWKLGLTFMLGGALWFWLTIAVIMPHFSPTGQPMLIGRYIDAGQHPSGIISKLLHNPGTFLRQFLLDSDHRAYLRILLLPMLFLPLLAPWVLVLAAPSLLLNMLSSNRQMYSGLYQYNAEIVPVLIFATIEGLLCAQWLAGRLLDRIGPQIAGERTGQIWQRWNNWLTHGSLVSLLLGLALFSTLRYDYRFHGQMPFTREFLWPERNRHTDLAEQIIQEIPAQASISAQSRLVPHLSHREKIYLFPYGSNQAEYIFLDVTSDFYPYFGLDSYSREAEKVLERGDYGVVDARDGYLLLKRGLAPPGRTLCPTLTLGSQNQRGAQLDDLLDEFCAEYEQKMAQQT